MWEPPSAKKPKGKGKVNHAAQESVAHLPLQGLEPVDGEPPMSVMRGQCDDRPTVILPSCKASPPLGWYQITLLGGTGTCVNNLPSVAVHNGAAGIPTRDLLIASPVPYCYATEAEHF